MNYAVEAGCAAASKNRFDAEGIEIPFPQVVHFDEGGVTYGFSVGDIVQMKKATLRLCPVEILRTGIDFRIKCCGCGHMVMLPRAKFEKNVKKIIPKEQ